MTTKLKIDLSQGLLEVEGSEVFVRTIYNDFKTHFAGIESPAEGAKRTRRSRRTPTAPPKTPTMDRAGDEEVVTPPPPRAAPPMPTYTIIKDLDLGAADDHPSLVEFMDSKFPITNEERNIVFLYYLQHMLNLKSITLDHVYTCYREARIRAPLNLENSLRMTAEHHGWIKTAKTGKMTLTSDGKQYVEKQLPKKVRH